nr:phosphonate C-P lyase system protein PhnH [Leisingera methylohalidivorans]
MNAIAWPGRIEEITGGTPPERISVAAGSPLLTLRDPKTESEA